MAEDAGVIAGLNATEAGQKLSRKKSTAAAILLVNGMDIPAITQMLEYDSEAACSKDIETAIATIGLDSFDKAQLRQIMGARLEQAWKVGITNASRRGYPAREAALANAIRAAEKIIKLYGLDAPTEMVVHTATTEQINAWIQSMMAERVAQYPQEVDVVQGTVVPASTDVATVPRG
jgi:hypothetical protein